MKKIRKMVLGFSMLLVMLLVVGCSEEKEIEWREPYVSIPSSANEEDKRGTYTVISEQYGVVTSGNCYNSNEKAVANPLEICVGKNQSITVKLAYNGYANTYTMTCGETTLMSTSGWTREGYLQVVLKEATEEAVSSDAVVTTEPASAKPVPST